jgi:hypothetical protein
MLTNHWFWGSLTLAVLAWYSTVTVYVAVKGVMDIKEMFHELSSRQRAEKDD